MTVNEVGESDLPSDFRDGLQELRYTHPNQEIEPVIAVGNMVVVCLGTFEVTNARFDEDQSGETLQHVHDEYEVFARLPRPFPNGNTKGFGTSPPIDRERRSIKNNPDWNPELQSHHEDYHDGPVEWYSWSWDGYPTSKPSDMKFAFDLAQRMLIHG